jgi:hypothetical protein
MRRRKALPPKGDKRSFLDDDMPIFMRNSINGLLCIGTRIDETGAWVTFMCRTPPRSSARSGTSFALICDAPRASVREPDWRPYASFPEGDIASHRVVRLRIELLCSPRRTVVKFRGLEVQDERDPLARIQLDVVSTMADRGFEAHLIGKEFVSASSDGYDLLSPVYNTPRRDAATDDEDTVVESTQRDRLEMRFVEDGLRVRLYTPSISVTGRLTFMRTFNDTDQPVDRHSISMEGVALGVRSDLASAAVSVPLQLRVQADDTISLCVDAPSAARRVVGFTSTRILYGPLVQRFRRFSVLYPHLADEIYIDTLRDIALVSTVEWPLEPCTDADVTHVVVSAPTTQLDESIIARTSEVAPEPRHAAVTRVAVIGAVDAYIARLTAMCSDATTRFSVGAHRVRLDRLEKTLSEFDTCAALVRRVFHRSDTYASALKTAKELHEKAIEHDASLCAHCVNMLLCKAVSNAAVNELRRVWMRRAYLGPALEATGVMASEARFPISEPTVGCTARYVIGLVDGARRGCCILQQVVSAHARLVRSTPLSPARDALEDMMCGSIVRDAFRIATAYRSDVGVIVGCLASLFDAWRDDAHLGGLADELGVCIGMMSDRTTRYVGRIPMAHDKFDSSNSIRIGARCATSVRLSMRTPFVDVLVAHDDEDAYKDASLTFASVAYAAFLATVAKLAHFRGLADSIAEGMGALQHGASRADASKVVAVHDGMAFVERLVALLPGDTRSDLVREACKDVQRPTASLHDLCTFVQTFSLRTCSSSCAVRYVDAIVVRGVPLHRVGEDRYIANLGGHIVSTETPPVGLPKLAQIRWVRIEARAASSCETIAVSDVSTHEYTADLLALQAMNEFAKCDGPSTHGASRKKRKKKRRPPPVTTTPAIVRDLPMCAKLQQLSKVHVARAEYYRQCMAEIMASTRPRDVPSPVHDERLARDAVTPSVEETQMGDEQEKSAAAKLPSPTGTEVLVVETLPPSSPSQCASDDGGLGVSMDDVVRYATNDTPCADLVCPITMEIFRSRPEKGHAIRGSVGPGMRDHQIVY